MKKIVFLFAISISFTSFGQTSAEEDIEQVKNLIIESFDEVWSKLDSEKLSTYHTEDFVLLEDGKVWNNDTISKYFKQGLQQTVVPKRVNKMEFIEVKVEGDMAWAAYQNYATFSVEEKVLGSAHWLESATAIRTEEGWKLEMLHSTVVEMKQNP